MTLPLLFCSKDALKIDDAPLAADKTLLEMKGYLTPAWISTDASRSLAGLSIVTFRPGRPDNLVFPPYLALRADEQAFTVLCLRLLAVPIHLGFAQIFDVQCAGGAEIDVSAGRPSHNVQRSDDFIAFR